MEILITTLSSSVIVGIFVFIFQQSYKAKLQQLSKRLDESIIYRSKDFDQSFVAINEVWKSIAKLEDYIKFDYAKDIDKGSITSEPIRPLWLEIKQSMALLPDPIFEPTNEFLEQFGKSWDQNCSEIIKLVNLAVENPEQHEALKLQVNDLLNKYRNELAKEMLHLRCVYRTYISEHFEKS